MILQDYLGIGDLSNLQNIVNVKLLGSLDELANGDATSDVHGTGELLNVVIDHELVASGPLDQQPIVVLLVFAREVTSVERQQGKRHVDEDVDDALELLLVQHGVIQGFVI